jgi:hypothetical protein
MVGVGPWAYFQGILDPYWRSQSEGSVEGAYHSDFYPRWVGTREALQHRADPYGPAVTEQIQRGYYGHAFQLRSKGDPQGFAYPAHVMVLIAPLAMLPFRVAQPIFRLLLFAMAAGLVPFFASGLNIHWNGRSQYWAILVLFSSFPLAEALYVEQFTIVVIFAIAATTAALVKGRLSLAGVLLSFSTIKPQVSFLLVLWLMLWAVTRWHERGRLLISFLVSTALLVFSAEALLPGWVTKWLIAAGAYLRYPNRHTVAAWLMPKPIGLVVTAVITTAALLLLWVLRTAQPSEERFGFAFALALALPLLIMPTWPFLAYNDLLLLPAALLIAKGWNMRVSVMPRALAFLLAGALACSSAFALLIALVVVVLRIPATRLTPWLDLPFFSFALVPLLASMALIWILWKERAADQRFCYSPLPIASSCHSSAPR